MQHTANLCHVASMLCLKAVQIGRQGCHLLPLFSQLLRQQRQVLSCLGLLLLSLVQCCSGFSLGLYCILQQTHVFRSFTAYAVLCFQNILSGTS